MICCGTRFGRESLAKSPRQAGNTGNQAFNDYRAETLKRLEEEEREFQEFLTRLLMAKDKVEFDQFMAARNARPAPEAPTRQQV